MGNPVVAAPLSVFDLTFSVPAEAVDDNDVLADTQEIPGVFRWPGASAKLVSLVLLDEGDQGTETDIVFLDSNVSLGTEDSAVSITDANARQIIGALNIPTTAYFDLVNSQVAVLKDINLVMRGASTSLFVGLITRGTPTYAATTDLKIKLGFELG